MRRSPALRPGMSVAFSRRWSTTRRRRMAAENGADPMQTPLIYADFQNADERGRLRRTAPGPFRTSRARRAALRGPDRHFVFGRRRRGGPAGRTAGGRGGRVLQRGTDLGGGYRLVGGAARFGRAGRRSRNEPGHHTADRVSRAVNRTPRDGGYLIRRAPPAGWPTGGCRASNGILREPDEPWRHPPLSVRNIMKLNHLRI